MHVSQYVLVMQAVRQLHWRKSDIHITRVRLHPNRLEAVATTRAGILSRWLLHGATPHLDLVMRTGHPHFAGLAVSPDGAIVVVAVPGNAVEIRAWDDLHVIRSVLLPPTHVVTRPPEVSAIALSPDGKWLAVADSAERAYLVDMVSGVGGWNWDAHHCAGREAEGRVPPDTQTSYPHPFERSDDATIGINPKSRRAAAEVGRPGRLAQEVPAGIKYAQAAL